MGIISFLFIGFLRIFRIPQRIIYCIAIVFLWIYCFFLGFLSPVLRATLMVSIYLFGKVIYRQPNIRNSLGAAVLIILFISPFEVFCAGFQLSFTAVISITLLYPNIKMLFCGERTPVGLKGYILNMAFISMSCWIGLMPFSIGLFHTVSFISVAANCIILPFIPFVIVGGLFKLLLAGSFFGKIICLVLEKSVGLIFAVLGFLKEVPFACVYIERAGLLFWCAYAAAVSIIIFYGRINRTVRKRVPVILAALSAVCIFLQASGYNNEKMLKAVDGRTAVKVVKKAGAGVELIADSRAFSYSSQRFFLRPFLICKGINELESVCLKDAGCANRYFFREFLKDWKVQKVFLPLEEDLLLWNRFEFVGPDAQAGGRE